MGPYFQQNAVHHVKQLGYYATLFHKTAISVGLLDHAMNAIGLFLWECVKEVVQGNGSMRTQELKVYIPAVIRDIHPAICTKTIKKLRKWW
ncbi:hypothetical protein Trydic_g9585 [Trypoxylus dichotomus]